MTPSFREDLEFSQGIVRDTCEETIMTMLTGCVNIEKSALPDDRNGIDYWATLRGGARVGIDHKARRRGCSRHWNNGPELAPEIWSVMPGGGGDPKPGWTLDESKETDLVLCTFHPSDSDQAFLIPFQHYRIAFRKYLIPWTKRFRVAIQPNGTWDSQCVFVPAWCVLDAIKEVSATDDPDEGLFNFRVTT